MIRPVFLFLVIITTNAFAQHPVSFAPGAMSQITMFDIYTTDAALKRDLFLLYSAEKYSEQSIFYYGKYDPWKEKKNKKNPLFNQDYIVPPHMLPIDEGKFMDQTEVAIIHYQEFLFFVVKDSGRYQDKKYEPLLENKYKSRYWLDPEFYFFPVTAVEFINAQDYCKWRAGVINEGLEEMLQGERKQYRYIGRLPTLEEWKQVAGPASLEIIDKSYTIDKKAQEYLKFDLIDKRLAKESILNNTQVKGYNVNLKHPENSTFTTEIPHYIYGFEPNGSGFYNMYGNVKEMVQEGFAVGGSFDTAYSGKDVLFNTTDDVQAYKMNVGFRCMMEIKK